MFNRKLKEEIKSLQNKLTKMEGIIRRYDFNIDALRSRTVANEEGFKWLREATKDHVNLILDHLGVEIKETAAKKIVVKKEVL